MEELFGPGTKVINNKFEEIRKKFESLSSNLTREKFELSHKKVKIISSFLKYDITNFYMILLISTPLKCTNIIFLF